MTIETVRSQKTLICYFTIVSINIWAQLNMNDFYHKNGDKTKKGLEKLISFDLPSLNTKHERKIQLFKKTFC